MIKPGQFDTSTHDALKLMQGFPPPPDKQVTRLNGWWEPPYNRWAYQHMRHLWPTAPIRPAPAPVHLPRRIDAAIDRLSVSTPDGAKSDFETHLRDSFTDSLLVIHNGAVVYERYLNGMTPQQPHIMFSCTKSFTGLLALSLIEDGRVSEATPLADILPELDNGGAYASARFGHVLDMTTAVQFNETYEDPAAEIHDYTAILGAGVKAEDPDRCQSLHAYAAALKPLPARRSGEVFEYKTPDADVLNWAVSRLSGQSFVENLERRIWARLGTSGEAYVMLDPLGTPFAGGGLCAMAEDVARFAAMMLNAGVFDGRQVLSASVIETLERGGSREAFLKGSSAAQSMAGGDWSYRAQWWVRHTPNLEAIMALGVNGQWIYIDRQRQVAVVKQSSLPIAGSWDFHKYSLNAIDAVIAYLNT